MTDRELMQQALEAMMTIRPYEVVDYDPLEASIAALRERLAQPEQEQDSHWLTKEIMADYLDLIAEAVDRNGAELLRGKSHRLRKKGEV